MGVLRWWPIGLMAACFDPSIEVGTPCSDQDTCPSPLVCSHPTLTCETEQQAPLGEFSPPTLMSLSDPVAFDADPMPTQDLLEIFFTSNRAGTTGGKDIWTATRSSVDAPWSVPVPVVELNSAEQDSAPHISADGLTIWFASARPGGLGLLDIWVATRSSRTTPWTAPVHVPEVSSALYDYGFAVTRSELIAYVGSTRSGNDDLYRFVRATRSEPWGPAMPVTELNTASAETNPFTSTDDRVLFFGSNRDGNVDLVVATRDDVSQPFGAPVAQTILNSPLTDSDAWLSPDLRTIMFTSSRDGVQADMFEASR
ncbi:MAG: TolB family protein [Kofleriaceae bacterium]